MPLDATTWAETQQDVDRRVLRKVRERIARHGAWSQHGSRQGAACIMGWTWMVAGYHAGNDLKSAILQPLALSEGWFGVEDMNDASRTTQADVVAFLDRAIEAATS